MYLRRHFRRIVVAQQCVGNVLDLSPRTIGQSEGPEVDVSRDGLADGSTTPKRRTHVIEIPVLDDDVVRLAEMMAEMSTMYRHQVRLYALSGGVDAAHMVWAEPSSMEVIPSPAGLRDIAPQAIRIETRVYHAAIGEGQNLLSAVPWEGASTPGSVSQADGLTTLDDGDVVVYDDASQDLLFYDGWDGTTYKRISSPAPAGITAKLSSYVRSGTEELLIVESPSQDIVRVDLQGNEIGRIDPFGQFGDEISTAGVTVAAGSLVVLSVTDTLHVYSGVPESGSPNASSSTSLTSTMGVEVTYDAASGDLLTVQDDGTVRVRRHDGTSDTVSTTESIATGGLSAYAGRLYSIDGAVLNDHGALGTSGVPTSSVGSADLTRRMPLRVRRAGRPERGYYGPTWTAGHACSVDITGVPDVVSSSQPIILEMPCPFGGAEVRLQGVTGAIDGYSFGGTALTIDDSSRIGSPPQVLLEGGKYTGLGINADTVWGVRCRIEDVVSRPELVVVSPGTPRGPLRGAYSEVCVASPAWAGGAVEAIAFDWAPDAGDQLSIDVTEAPGVDSYRGQISGEGEAVQGTSAVFEADAAGTYTAEMVAEYFEGQTGVELSGPVDMATVDMTTLDDLTRVEYGNGPNGEVSGVPTAKAHPEGVEFVIYTGSGAQVDLSTLPDSLSNGGSVELANSNAGLNGSTWSDMSATNLGSLSGEDSFVDEAPTASLIGPATTFVRHDKVDLGATTVNVTAADSSLVEIRGRGNATGNWETFLNTHRTFQNSFFLRGGDGTGDLSGTNGNGNPVLPSSLVEIRGRADVAKGPTEWAHLTNFERLGLSGLSNYDAVLTSLDADTGTGSGEIDLGAGEITIFSFSKHRWDYLNDLKGHVDGSGKTEAPSIIHDGWSLSWPIESIDKSAQTVRVYDPNDAVLGWTYSLFRIYYTGDGNEGVYYLDGTTDDGTYTIVSISENTNSNDTLATDADYRDAEPGTDSATAIAN